ncbi:MAG: response regulator transcription factor [Acetobacteraceae bacterium]
MAVIDDDPAVLDSLQLMLEVAGYRVAVYGSAGAFLANRVSEPACLILDHHMSPMTGLDLVARMRAEGMRVPVLLITGRSSARLFARAAQLDIEKVLEKPPSEGDILGFVARFGCP